MPPLKEIISGVEKRLILEALESVNWSQVKAARRLGISQRVLNYKIKKYRITIKPKTRREKG